MKVINRDIVGAFIFSIDGKILLGKNIAGRTYQGLWTIPGGGVEAGETTEDAVKREILEEVGLDISSANLVSLERKFGESTKKIGDEIFLVKMVFHDYTVQMQQNSGDMILTDGDDFEQATWVDIGDLKNLNIAPPAKKTLQLLQLI